jgi:FtsH-binding integral membrane protein
MDGYRVDDRPPWHESYAVRVGLALLGIIAFDVIGIAPENLIGLPFDTTYRVACAVICLLFIYDLGRGYPGEQWHRVSLWVALIVNAGLFFTPLVSRPASRGEVMLFALPDVVIVLIARIASYPVKDDHQRAMRQQMILGLIVAVVICVVLFGLTLAGPRGAPR